MDNLARVEIDGVELSYFARRYSDSGAAARAMERARAKIRLDDHLSVLRFQRQAGDEVIAVASAHERMARRALERVAWGGEAETLSDDEARTVGRRVVDVVGGAAARGEESIDSSANWEGVGGLDVSPRGTHGARRRPQG